MESKNNNQESPMMRVSLINPCVERNVRYLIFLVCCLCLSPFYYGYSMTYISTIDPDTFYKYFGQNAGKLQVIGYLIGTMPLGAAVGALTAPFLMNHLTRKNFLLLFNALAIIICGVLQINNLYLLFGCRFFQGVVVGNYMGIIPIYIKQLTPIGLRGKLGALSQFFNIGGVVICYSFGLAFKLTEINQQFFWRFMFAFTGVTVVFQSIFLLFDVIPESPVSLLENRQFKEARRILAIFNSSQIIESVFVQYIKLTKWNQFEIRYRQKQDQLIKKQWQKDKENDVQLKQRDSTTPAIIKTGQHQPQAIQQYQHVDDNIGGETPKKQMQSASRKHSSWSNYTIELKELQERIGNQKSKVKISIKTFIVGFQLPLMQPISGCKVVAVEIGAIMGMFSQGLAIYTPLAINVIQLIGTMSSIPLITKYGRRPIILAGNFGTAACSLAIGFFFLIAHITKNQKIVIGSLVFIVLFMIIYGLTIGPTVWLYVPQIIPPRCVPPATSTNWLGVAFSVMVAPLIITGVGSPYPVFFLFSGLSFLFFIINYYNVVETKNLHVSEIEKQVE